MKVKKMPKTATYQNNSTIYMGHANGNGGAWDLFYCDHFQSRTAEREIGLEKAETILASIFEDAILNDSVTMNYIISVSARRQVYGFDEKRQRFQIMDDINGVSFILEIYPDTKEIFVLTVLTPNDGQPVKRKINNVVIRVFPETRIGETVVSAVKVYDWIPYQTRFKKITEREIDASAIRYE